MGWQYVVSLGGDCIYSQEHEMRKTESRYAKVQSEVRKLMEQGGSIRGDGSWSADESFWDRYVDASWVWLEQVFEELRGDFAYDFKDEDVSGTQFGVSGKTDSGKEWGLQVYIDGVSSSRSGLKMELEVSGGMERRVAQTVELKGKWSSPKIAAKEIKAAVPELFLGWK